MLRAGRYGDRIQQIPAAERFKARVGDRSLAGVTGSNPAEGIMFVLYVLYNKDKSIMQDNEDKEVRIQYRERTKKIRVEARFSTFVQTGPEAHPASYTMGTGFPSRR